MPLRVTTLHGLVVPYNMDSQPGECVPLVEGKLITRGTWKKKSQVCKKSK